MPRQPIVWQPDLFDPPGDAKPPPTPLWRSLPDDAPPTLTELMARLILDHTDSAACQ